MCVQGMLVKGGVSLITRGAGQTVALLQAGVRSGVQDLTGVPRAYRWSTGPAPGGFLDVKALRSRRGCGTCNRS